MIKTEQRIWTPEAGWSPKACDMARSAQLVFVFGSTGALEGGTSFEDIRGFYPGAQIVGCSTAGGIAGTSVSDDSVLTTAVSFERTQVKGAHISISTSETSEECGQKLAALLPQENLVHVFVLSDGIKVNGSELVRGMMRALPRGVQVTGGLAGDGARFLKTMVLLNQPAASGQIVALGFYGSSLTVGYGSLGGWDPFGPDRVVTRSSGNVLYELDSQPALALYKRYLGEHASGLPATGLLFPLSVRSRDGGHTFVRTILAVDEKEQSLTFAGDVPEGTYARLMKSNFDRVVEGAQGAAETCYKSIGSKSPELAILISCVGRKLVLKQRTEEELEAVQEVLGDGTALAGFYSYGEISPSAPDASCELHNQTMTITTFSES